MIHLSKVAAASRENCRGYLAILYTNSVSHPTTIAWRITGIVISPVDYKIRVEAPGGKRPSIESNSILSPLGTNRDAAPSITRKLLVVSVIATHPHVRPDEL